MDKSSKGSENIEEFLKSLEKKYGVSIILAVETGSRGHGLDTDQSDYDIKGLYIPTASVSEEICKKDVFSSIRLMAASFKGFKVPLDIEFIELKTFLNEMKEGKDLYLRWLFSDVIYRNKYPEIRETMLEKCDLPRSELVKRIQKDLDKADTNGNMREPSKIMNMLVDALLLLWFQRKNEYPVYKVNALAEKLKELENEGLEEKVSYLMEQMQQLYYVKKKGKCKSIAIDEEALEFVRSVVADDANKTKSRSNQLTKEVVTELLKSLAL